MHDIQAKLVAQPDGSLSLESAHFRGTRGLVNVTGRAHATRGLVDEIKIGATIARNDAFPLVVSGQAMGDAWGRLDVSVKPKDAGFAVAVDVPSLHVTLPDVSPRALQELGAAPNVSIGVRARGEIVPVALAPPQRPKRGALPVTIAVNLGNDVQIVRGDMLNMTLTGRPVVHIGDQTTMTGSIRLVRGTLDVQGKRFEIERGLVTFVSEPSNPNLDVVAGWNAPDGSHVTAQYLGAVKDGRLVLSSDPPHTQDEIVALLVFGSANGPTPSTGSSGENLAAKAISTGASFATQPFNKALEQLTHVDVKVRIDTSSTAAKSEVEVQIAKNISAQVAYVIGIPPPGADPDLTWLTLAWHATAHWSFDFTIGDHGSTIVDSMWHLRY
jgi:translocation and assembly module TamB